MGLSRAQSGYFGMDYLLNGADTSAMRRELEQATKLFQECGRKNKEMAAAQIMLRLELENFTNSKSKAAPFLPVDGPDKDFLIGALGITVALTFIVAGCFGFYSGPSVFIICGLLICVVPLLMRLIGSFMLSVSNEVRLWIGLSAMPARHGFKGAVLGILILFAAGITGKIMGADILFGVAVPAGGSGSMVEWTLTVAWSPFGLIFLYQAWDCTFSSAKLGNACLCPDPCNGWPHSRPTVLGRNPIFSSKVRRVII